MEKDGEIVQIGYWRKITCAQRDAIFYAERPEKLCPISSCTDLSAEFHSEPQMDITWGLRSTETPVLRESRYPSRDGGPDRKPCEHWEFHNPHDFRDLAHLRDY